MALKHVGRIASNRKKVGVVYRMVPGEAESCLVVLTESLSAEEHDSFMKVIESNAGQTAVELADAMNRATLPDGRNMFIAFHTFGTIQKYPTKDIEMTPAMVSSVNLAELNQIIADQQVVTIHQLAGGAQPEDPKPAEDLYTAQTEAENYASDGVLSDEDLINENLVDYTDGTDKIAKETGQLDSIDDEAKFIQLKDLGPGSKVARVRIVDFVDNSSGIEDNGITFGITNRSIDPEEENLTDEQKTFYIKFVRSGTAYKYKVKGGTEQTSTVLPQTVAGTSADNDYLEIAISFGKIEGRIFKSNPDSTHLLFSETFERTNNSEQSTLGFAPFITFQGSESSVKVQHYRAHYLTYPNNNLFNSSLNTVVNFGANDPPNGGTGTGGAVILTLHDSLVNYFGFNSEITKRFFKQEPEINLVIGFLTMEKWGIPSTSRYFS